ncbi:hypothetical protein ACFQE1_06050, partial [Halobium palmae]
MATDTSSDRIESFGQVSRTVGTAFRYLLLAATMFGIVTLAIFLVYVANDAIQPLTADPGWHLTFLLTLVLPTLGVGGYLYARDRSALSLGATVLGMLLVTLMFGAGLAMRADRLDRQLARRSLSEKLSRMNDTDRKKKFVRHTNVELTTRAESLRTAERRAYALHNQGRISSRELLVRLARVHRTAGALSRNATIV